MNGKFIAEAGHVFEAHYVVEDDGTVTFRTPTQVHVGLMERGSLEFEDCVVRRIELVRAYYSGEESGDYVHTAVLKD